MRWAVFAAVSAIAVGIVAVGVSWWRLDRSIPTRPAVAVIRGPDRQAAVTKYDVGSSAPVNRSAAVGTSMSDAPSLDQQMIARMARLAEGFPAVKERLNTLRAEARDPIWAPASERLLKHEYTAIPHIGRDGRVMSIYCGTRNCAVIGDLPSDTERHKVNEAMSSLQSPDLIAAMMAQGYKNNGSGFGPSASDNRQMFVTFYKRSVPTKMKLGQRARR